MTRLSAIFAARLLSQMTVRLRISSLFMASEGASSAAVTHPQDGFCGTVGWGGQWHGAICPNKSAGLSHSDTVNPCFHPPVKINDTNSFVVDKSRPGHKAGLLIA